MNIRITAQSQTANALANIRLQQSAVAKYQNQVTSGYRVATASDDPGAYVDAARTNSVSERYKTYQGTITDSTSDLNSGVTALTDTGTILTQAKQLASQGVDPTIDAVGAEGLAAQVDGLIGQLLAAANTQTDTGYLFGGAKSGAPPFVVAAADLSGKPTSITYAGDSSRAQVLIGPGGQTADTRYVGSNVFQAANGDAFATLIQIRDNLRNAAITPAQRGAALAQNIAQLTTASDRISSTLGEQAGTLASLDTIQSHLLDLKLTSDSRLSDLVSTDFTEAVVKLQQQDTAFQASLAVSSKINKTSLLDYIA